jgi:hypothetical protein
MGSSFPTPAQARKMAKENADHYNKLRMGLADKIVLAIVDRISADIIRPGPKPEERECYVVAQELRAHSPELKKLVVAILRQEEEADVPVLR